MTKNPFSKEAQEPEKDSLEWMIQEAKRLGYVYADNRFLSWVDARIGKPVGDLCRSCIVHTRQWMIRNGLPVGKIRLDDMISYVFMGIKRSASGMSADDGFAKSISLFKKSVSFSNWVSSTSTSLGMKFSLANSTKTFKKWFSGSKAVNQDGEPKILHLQKHREVSVFKDMVWGSADNTVSQHNPKEATGESPDAEPIYMSIKSPFNGDRLKSPILAIEFFDELAAQSPTADQYELARLLSAVVESATPVGSQSQYAPADFWINTKSVFGADGAEAIRSAFDVAGFDGVSFHKNDILTFGAFSSSQVVSASAPELINDVASETSDEKELIKTATPEFANFFKNSKVTEADGSPKIVYHGTDKEFSVFNTARGGWFITDPIEATAYGSEGPATNVVAAYLSIQKPYISSHMEKNRLGTDRLLEKARTAGHDGILLPADSEIAESFVYDEAYHDVWIALSPNQIKSATNNNGSFSPQKPDIYFSRRPAKSNPYFKKWFDGSKVVNRKGEPLVLFHGTDQDFDSFDKEKIGSNFTYDEKGFFFTSSTQEASDYAIDNTVGLSIKKQNGNVMPVYISIKSPLIIDPKFLKSMGMSGLLGEEGTLDTITFWDTYQTLILEWADEHESDGVIIVDPSFKEMDGEPRRMVVAFEPEQIKSAIGNNGKYNPFTADIRFSKSGIGKSNQGQRVSYPLAEPGTRSEETEKDTVWMSPNEYLSCVRPLTLDDESRDSISSLVEHILSGRKLDPLVIYADGSEDGRHRAYAAIEVGIEKVPVVDYRVQEMSHNKNFDAWFEDSKIVDEHGAPLIVYHGTMSEFSEFSMDFFGEGNSNADFGDGFYFTDQVEAANTYAEGEGGNVMPVYLRINNPATNKVMLSSEIQDVIDDGMGFEELSEVLEEMGYDGVEFTHQDGNKEYVVFDPNQIKSALGNNGAFSKDNNDIRFSRSGAENGAVVDKYGNLKVVYHGTTCTRFIPPVTTAGSESARSELQAMAEQHSIKDWTSVPRVFERWVNSGIAEKQGIAPEDARRARELAEQSNSTVISESKTVLGFEQFEMPSDGKELGAHFGTKLQAERFGEVFPFHLFLKNPIRLPDMGTWHYQSVMRELRKQGVAISEEEYDTVFNAFDNNQALRDLMLSKGIDGVVYKNEAEGKGDSYIAFSNEQIRHVAAQAENNNDFAFSKNSHEQINSPSNEVLTESRLMIEIAKNFPRLASVAQTIFERGREGKPGGAVIIDSNRAEDIADIVSKRTGYPYQDCLQVFSDGDDIYGFYEPRIQTSFIVGRGMSAEKGVSVLFHELAHDQQIDRINQAAKELMSNKQHESASICNFLNRVEQRLIDTNESNNASEILPYIIEQAIMESFVDRHKTNNIDYQCDDVGVKL